MEECAHFGQPRGLQPVPGLGVGCAPARVSNYWGMCVLGECRLRTLYDLSEDAKLEPVGEVNKRVHQTRQKTVQHLRLHLLL